MIAQFIGYYIFHDKAGFNNLLLCGRKLIAFVGCLIWSLCLHFVELCHFKKSVSYQTLVAVNHVLVHSCIILCIVPYLLCNLLPPFCYRFALMWFWALCSSEKIFLSSSEYYCETIWVSRGMFILVAVLNQCSPISTMINLGLNIKVQVSG